MASRQQSPKCISGAFESPDAVVIVPYHLATEKLALIREYRVTLGGYQYGFPAGLVDPGESIQEAAVRELEEETGLQTLAVIGASPPVYSSPGVTDESVAMVFVTCKGEPSNGGNEASEDITVEFIGPADARLLCDRSDAKIDVKAWLVLMAYAAGLDIRKMLDSAATHRHAEGRHNDAAPGQQAHDSRRRGSR
jgi:ADP-ribose pyrophosphatase